MPSLSFAEDRASQAEQYRAFRGFSLSHTREQVAEALSHFGRLGIFSEYTKHDITHIDGMLRLYDWLIPEQTAAVMSEADWLLLVLSTYLHDFGLLVTEEEYRNRQSSDFPRFVEEELRMTNSLSQDYSAKVKALPPNDRERFLYQEFVRANHASRIRSWLAPRPSLALGLDQNVVEVLHRLVAPLDPVFVEDVGLVCESHHREDLNDIEKYPLNKPYGPTDRETANVQYAGILLRAADLLHITGDRAPSISMKVVNPSNPISQAEWAKQHSVRNVRSKIAVNDEGELAPAAPRNTIEVFASFDSDVGFFGLTRYLRFAQDELRQCYGWAAESNKRYAIRHRFPWRHIDSTNVRANGFVSTQFEFQIDQHKILDLLTGHTLYNDVDVVLRELVQNAIDAVRLQRAANEGDDIAPTVWVRWDQQKGVLEVSDNGTGMSQSIIEGNFLRVGSSRYQEPEFKKKHPNFSPISRFGIGVLSAFMIADNVQVVTSHPDDEQARELTLESVHGEYLIRLFAKSDEQVPQEIREHGTAVRLQLRPSAGLGDVEKILRKWIVVPGCRVIFEADGRQIEIGHPDVASALRASLRRIGILVDDEEDGTDGRKWKIYNFCRPGFEIAFAASWDKWNQEWHLVNVSPQSAVDDRFAFAFGTCVEGVRVSLGSPGFRGDVGVFAIANATGLGAPKTNVARTDIERTVEFDNFLRNVYESYAEYINDEVDKLRIERNSSDSKAAREAVYLFGPLVGSTRKGGRVAESARIFDECAMEVKAFVVESGGDRRLYTLKGLLEHEELATLDSPVTRYLGYFLESISSSPPLSRILEFAENDNFPLPDIPILGEQVQMGYLADLFKGYWEVSSITSHIQPAVVLARWTKRVKDRLWVRSSDRANIDTEVVQMLERLAREFETGIADWLYAPVGPVTFDLAEPDFDAVVVGQDFYMLPSHPLLSLQPLVDLDKRTLHVIGASLAAVFTADHRWDALIATDLPYSRHGLTNFIPRLERAGLFKFVDREDVLSAFQRGPRVLNVMRWDRRSSNRS